MRALLYFVDVSLPAEFRLLRRSEQERLVTYVDDWTNTSSNQGTMQGMISETNDVLHRGRIDLVSSHLCHPIQLADFVATSFSYALRRVESGREFFPLHEQALRVATHQNAGSTIVPIVVGTDDDGRRWPRRLLPDERPPDGAEHFSWDKRSFARPSRWDPIPRTDL